MNFKDKIDRIDAASMTAEELYAEIGTTEDEYVAKTMKLLKQKMFQAKVATGRAKSNRIIGRFKEVIVGIGTVSENLRIYMTTHYPAVQFRNLDKMTDEQIMQIAQDIEILKILDDDGE